MKYQFTGQKNKKCPVCNKSITGGSYPVIFFYKGSKLKEHMWCDVCFDLVRMINHSTYALLNEAVVKVTEISKKALGSVFPEDGIVGGYWISIDESMKQQLVLVVDLKDEY